MDSFSTLGIAVLLHDPPWKPWAIRPGGIRGGCRDATVSSILGRHGLSTCSGAEKILHALKSLASVRIKELADYYGRVIDEARDRGLGIRAHEKSSVLFAGLLGLSLREEGLKHLSNIAWRAGWCIAGLCENSDQLRRADYMASAMDRILLQRLDEAMGGTPGSPAIRGPRRLEYVNPLNPEYSAVLPDTIDASRIAGFMAYYSSSTARMLRMAGGEENSMLLLHVAHALLEPLWYKHVGPKYVPVADTRIPTHTVFDHVNAALTTMLWMEEEKPKGCLGVVDLAGVQAWIGEARRPRDLWAASWLASFLAWKSVEPLVDEYGPGVLVQPPVRLHPFYSSRLISRLGFSSINEMPKDLRWLASALGLPSGWPIDATVPSRLLVALPPKACGEFEENAQKNYVNAWRLVSKGVLSYVNEVCSLARKEICRAEEECVIDDACSSGLIKAAEDMEPPLALRLFKVSLEEAFTHAESAVRKALRKLGTGSGYSGDPGEDMEVVKLARTIVEGPSRGALGDTAWSLLYPIVTLRMLPRREGEIRISSPGRKTGRGYLSYASQAWKHYVSSPESRVRERILCTMCGSGIRLIDGGILRESLAKARLTKSRLKALSPLLEELRDERLCPYCLVKRLLRRTIVEGRLGRELTGLDIPSAGDKEGGSRAWDLLGWETVDCFTSRTRSILSSTGDSHLIQAMGKVLEAAYHAGGEEGLLVLYAGLLERGFSPRLCRGLDVVARRAAEAFMAKHVISGEKLGKNDLLDMAGRLASALVEMMHDKGLVSELLAIHGERGLGAFLKEGFTMLEEAAGTLHSRFSLLASDADYMGSGILQGRLGMEPEAYVDRTLRLEPERMEVAKQALVKTIRALIDSMWEDDGVQEADSLFRAGETGCCDKCSKHILSSAPPTTLVTPSYHFTVSRALAAAAQRDRIIVEDLGGMIIYAGGDDLLALMPAADAGNRSIPSLEAAVGSRLGFWGWPQGFIVVGASDQTAGVVPALSAYGRSFVVYYGHVKTPLWLHLRVVRRLEESKDEACINYPLKSGLSSESSTYNMLRNTCKDVLMVASDASGAALIPLKLPERRGAGTSWSPWRPDEELRGMLRLLEDKKLNRGLLRDALEFKEILVRASELDPQAGLEVLRLLLKRNSASGWPGKNKDIVSEVFRAVGSSSGTGVLVELMMQGGGEVGRLIAVSGYSDASETGHSFSKTCSRVILSLGLLGALRVVRTAL